MSGLQASLHEIFAEINRAHFDGFLEPPLLRWNSRLRSAAGRFFPGHRKLWHERPPIIEIASYLSREQNALALVTDTLAHEMIHYWLWVRRLPYGHTTEFHAKMNLMGVSRYNTVPRQRPYKYVYRCSFCEGEFKARRKLGPLACAKCCKQHNGGRYDSKYKLELAQHLDPVRETELAEAATAET